MMGNTDFFHEIAKTAHPLQSTDREIVPLNVSKHMLPQTDKRFLVPLKWMSYEEQKIIFKEELEALRKYYQPFMGNHLSQIEAIAEKVFFTTFLFRYIDKGECFTHKDDTEKAWKKVEIPDYRGPAGVDGKWEGYYKKIFTYPEQWIKKIQDGYRIIIQFQCVDYSAQIYINNNYVGGHEGFFAPFSIDITKYLQKENTLIILCKNDIPILGEGEFLDGDKIYAATGPGWDDPQVGWHHCPAGAGVFGKVSLELRPPLYIEDVFVRPDIDKDMAEVRISVINYTDYVVQSLKMDVCMEPKNYSGDLIGKKTFEITAIGPGKNEYRYFIPLATYRLWEFNTPWLYGVNVRLYQHEKVVSGRQETFGIKSFISDETSVPKGKFYFNYRPIVLRGANEMGHLQQCIMNGNEEQLIDDILIAKLCNMNYYRITQRPVQEEIYQYFDMLGMLQQCDFPLFGFLRRPQFAEAIKQVGEMEHLVRKHVSTVMTTFINEPMCLRKTENPKSKFSKRYNAKGHRHLLRDELEAFFVAARQAIYIENPDRVVKNVEGDYDGPTSEGMPDFHIYTMWYTNHGQPIGKLMEGYLPPVKEGWMIGCGEYGAEGLDPEEVMMNDYPKEWIKKNKDGHWYPDKIVRAQTHSVQGDWYKEQKTMTSWIRESQRHQAKATKLMTDAFRRRGDVIHHTAVHLLIDAWPSGWMKALVDHRRMPKRGYFALQESLIPLKLNLYTSRKTVYENETAYIDVWLLNDQCVDKKIFIHSEIFDEDNVNAYQAFEEETYVQEVGSKCIGRLPVTFLKKNKNRSVYVQVAMLDTKGDILYQEKIEILVYKRENPPMNRLIHVFGDEGKRLAKLYEIPLSNEGKVVLGSGIDAKDIQIMEREVKSGKTVLWLLPNEKVEISFLDTFVRTEPCGDLFFVAGDGRYEDYKLDMMYNKEKDYIDCTARFTVNTDLKGEDLLYTYQKSGFTGSAGAKPRLPFVKKCSVGQGVICFITLLTEGRSGYNGGLDQLILDLIKGEV